MTPENMYKGMTNLCCVLCDMADLWAPLWSVGSVPQIHIDLNKIEEEFGEGRIPGPLLLYRTYFAIFNEQSE